MTAPTLLDYSFQYGVNGIVLNGAPFTDGTIIDIENVQGLDSAPAKEQDSSLDGRDGGIVYAEYEDVRPISLTGTVYGGSIPIMTTLEALKANFALSKTAQPLFIQPGSISARLVNCKALGCKYDWTTALQYNVAPIVFNLKAEDPTIYGTSVYSILGNLIPAGSTPGYTFPRTFSYTFGGGGISTNAVTLINNGTKSVGFTATITQQACVNPRLISDTVGKSVTTSLTVGSSDTAVFNFFTEKLSLNGSPRGSAVVNEGWFKLRPGSNSLRFQADSTTPATITFSFSDGYR